jgi:hypothetical protein
MYNVTLLGLFLHSPQYAHGIQRKTQYRPVYRPRDVTLHPRRPFNQVLLRVD